MGYAVGTSGHDELHRYCLVSAESASSRGLAAGELIDDGGSGCAPDERAYCWSFSNPNPGKC